MRSGSMLYVASSGSTGTGVAGAVGHANAVLAAAKGSKALFELPDLLADDRQVAARVGILGQLDDTAVLHHWHELSFTDCK